MTLLGRIGEIDNLLEKQGQNLKEMHEEHTRFL